MTSLLLIAASSVALILFVAFIIARLLRSRTAGLSIRMQIFLALAGIVGTFAFGLGVLVVDRVKARATFLAEESARAEATAVAKNGTPFWVSTTTSGRQSRSGPKPRRPARIVASIRGYTLIRPPARTNRMPSRYSSPAAPGYAEVKKVTREPRRASSAPTRSR